MALDHQSLVRTWRKALVAGAPHRKPYTHAQLMILDHVAERAGTQWCQQSVAQIADECCVTRSYANRTLQRMVEDGLVIIPQGSKLQYVQTPRSINFAWSPDSESPVITLPIDIHIEDKTAAPNPSLIHAVPGEAPLVTLLAKVMPTHPRYDNPEGRARQSKMVDLWLEHGALTAEELSRVYKAVDHLTGDSTDDYWQYLRQRLLEAENPLKFIRESKDALLKLHDHIFARIIPAACANRY